MRNAFAAEFYDLAQKDERSCLVVADIFPAGPLEKFREEHPQRFVNTGVAEQIMIGMCAGMAMRGLRPFALSIATFALFRPYEFVRDDLCYQGLPVTVVGVGGGMTYSQLGGTHHAMEDVAIACAMPNMRVIAPCDPLETAAATRWCAQQEEGPVYLRLGKAGEPILTSDAMPWEFGKLRMLRGGRDTCVLGYGPILKLALDVPGLAVASVHTLKPLDRAGITSILFDYKRVVVLEEMVPHGGLADAVKGLAYDVRANCRITSLTLKDEFIHVYGTHADVRAAHGLTKEALVSRI